MGCVANPHQNQSIGRCNKRKYTLLKKSSLPIQTLLSLSKLALLASDENNGAELEGKLAYKAMINEQ